MFENLYGSFYYPSKARKHLANFLTLEIRAYKESNREEINKLTVQVINDTCKKAIPGFDWVVVVKHIGLFGLCLVPAISFLIEKITEDGILFDMPTAL